MLYIVEQSNVTAFYRQPANMPYEVFEIGSSVPENPTVAGAASTTAENIEVESSVLEVAGNESSSTGKNATKFEKLKIHKRKLQLIATILTASVIGAIILAERPVFEGYGYLVEIKFSVRQLLSYGRNLKESQKYMIHKWGRMWNWHEAREECNNMDAHLPVFLDESEWITFLKEYLPRLQ